MRTFLGIVLLILGIPVLLVGAATAVLVGTDDTVDAVTEEISTESAALVLPSSVIGLSGPTLVVTAEVEGADAFVGAGHPVHVNSLLGGAAQTRVSEITTSRELTLREMAADDEAVVTPPADLDWWQEQSVGGGAQTIEVELTEEPFSVLVTAAEPAAPMSATVTGAVKLENLFTTAILVGVVGLVLVVLGILSLRSGRRRKRARKAAESESVDSWSELWDDTEAGVPAGGGAEAGSTASDTMTDLAPIQPTPHAPPPPSPPSGGQGRTFRVLGIAIPATALLAGGCASIPQTLDASSNALVAATPEQNEAFFAGYTTTNNDANAAQDPNLIATVETGPLLAASEFGFRVEKAQGLDPNEPFTITPTALAAPEFESYPLFYFASAMKGEGDDGGGAHYLLTRASAKEPWKSAAVVDLTEEQPFDLVAVAGETPAVADEAAVESGVAALELVREFAETGKAPEGLTAEAAQSVGDLSTLGFSVKRNEEGVDTLQRDCKVAPAAEGAWVTTDTGVLAIATATCTQQLRTSSGFWFTPGDDYGTFKGGTDLTSTTVTGVVPFLAEVSNDGTLVVHGGNLSLTGTDGVTR